MYNGRLPNQFRYTHKVRLGRFLDAPNVLCQVPADRCQHARSKLQHAIWSVLRQVFGIFMRNWDETEELGNQNCSVERDFQVLQSLQS